MRAFLTFAFLLLTSCATGNPAGILPLAPDRDPWGDAYPAACTRDASIAAAKSLTIIEVNNLPVMKGTASRCGYFDDRFDPPLIYVLKHCAVDGRTVSRDEVLRHEGCHALAPGGDPHWHP